MEGGEEATETLNCNSSYIVRPTTIKVTTNGEFVTVQEAGREKVDSAEAAWVERDGKGASRDCKTDIGDRLGRDKPAEKASRREF